MASTKREEKIASGVRVRDRYDVRRAIGEGGMGVVYEAFDRVRQVRVALKTMRNLDAVGLYRFKNEFRALADVSHPNLVALHELDADGEQAFFTMEFIDGVDFRKHVSRDGLAAPTSAALLELDTPDPGLASPSSSLLRRSLPVVTPRAAIACDVDKLRDALAQLVEGVAALHVAGKLHRDLKPSNVMVNTEGRVVLLDFGLVASLTHDPQQTIDRNVVGTPEYMSPEQASSAELSEASDWYGVGVILYEALTGQLPFKGPALKVLVDKQHLDPPKPRELVQGVPDDLDVLCSELLRRDPAKRPTAQAMFKLLGRRTGPVSRSSSRKSIAPTMSSLSAAFIGREPHFQALSAAFDEAKSGRATIAYVHGESGMGKSALVRRWVEGVAERQEAVVLSGRCYERESVPYKALDSVVDALSTYLRRKSRLEAEALLPLEIHALTRLFPVLNRVEAVSGARRRTHEIPDPHELRRRAASALRELFERMVERTPVVLWIDDLQWGDVDSAALIAELLRPPNPPPLMLVVSYRAEDASSPLVAALRAVPKSGAEAQSDACITREIEVGPLDRREARELARSLLASDTLAARGQAEMVADESRGSPFFVDELVRHLTTGQSLRASYTGANLKLDDVVYARVEALPDDARALLEVVAVAGRPIARVSAGAAAGLEGEREVTALAVLRAGKLVRSLRASRRDDLETYHDRIRETVRARLDPEDRAQVHLRVARALVAQGNADPEALVVHFSEAGERRDAAEFAAIAAAKAVEALAFDRAAALWRSALARSDLTPEAIRTLRWKLGDALADAGRGTEAAEAYLLATQGASSADGLELRRRAAEQLLRCGRIDEGMRAISDVLAAVGLKIIATPWLVLLTIVYFDLRLRIRGLKYKVRDLTETSQVERTRIDICWSVAAMLSTVHPIQANVFKKRHLLLALRLGEPSRIGRGLALEASSSAIAGVPSRGRTTRYLDAVRAVVAQYPDPLTRAWLSSQEGISAYLEGRFRAAVELCDRASDELRMCSHGARWEITSTLLFAAQSLFHLGELTELARRMPLIALEARQRGDLYALTNLRIGWNNAMWLAADDADRAEHELDEAMRQWGAPDEQLQQYYELLARAQVAIYRGDARSALGLLEARVPMLARGQLFRVQTVRVFVQHLIARASLSALAEPATNGARSPADAARRTEDALAASRRIRRENLRWSNPYASVVEAAIAARAGDRARALALLDDAIVDFDACDMRLWSAAAARRRGALIGGAEGRAIVDACDARFRAQLVKQPARFCDLLLPGFPLDPSTTK